MSLRLNETAPDFTAETTQGKISFHDKGKSGRFVSVEPAELPTA